MPGTIPGILQILARLISTWTHFTDGDLGVRGKLSTLLSVTQPGSDSRAAGSRVCAFHHRLVLPVADAA